MGKDTGLYSYTCQKAKDIFNKNYSKLKFSPLVSSRFAIRSWSRNGVYKSIYSTQFKEGNFATDIQVILHRDPNIFATFSIDGHDLVPGLKAIFSFDILKPRSEVIRLQYHHDHAGINVHITGFTGNPVLNFSGWLRGRTISVGTDVSFDTTGNFTTGKCGITLRYADLTSTLTFDNKGSTLNASYCHKLYGKLRKNINVIQRALASLSIVAVGAEASHNLSTHQNTITFSTQIELGCATTLKACYNNGGVASAVIRSMVTQNSFVTISSRLNTKAADRTPKFGVGFDTKF